MVTPFENYFNGKMDNFYPRQDDQNHPTFNLIVDEMEGEDQDEPIYAKLQRIGKSSFDRKNGIYENFMTFGSQLEAIQFLAEEVKMAAKQEGFEEGRQSEIETFKIVKQNKRESLYPIDSIDLLNLGSKMVEMINYLGVDSADLEFLIGYTAGSYREWKKNKFVSTSFEKILIIYVHLREYSRLKERYDRRWYTFAHKHRMTSKFVDRSARAFLEALGRSLEDVAVRTIEKQRLAEQRQCEEENKFRKAIDSGETKGMDLLFFEPTKADQN